MIFRAIGENVGKYGCRNCCALIRERRCDLNASRIELSFRKVGKQVFEQKAFAS